MEWTQRYAWADEIFSRITEAVNDRDPFRLYALIADPMPNGLGDRASASEVIDAFQNDGDPMRLSMVIGLLHSGWDDTSQEWPTVADISDEV